MARRDPLRVHLPNAAPPAMRRADAPFVSVIVRSMDRPQLAHALASLARQTCASLEILVVDATGGRHRPLPETPLREGHTMRLVATGRRLLRPHAANAGIDAVRGEFFSFLDDDDTCEPQHVQTLLDAAALHPDKLVVYGRTRVIAADGRVERLMGGPFNRALLHCGPLFFWQAALIRTRVRDLGCRVEESLEICEDRDFLAQVARHSDFAFIDAATFNYRADSGTSGTGRGANRDEGRRLQFDALLRARWKGPATYHLERVTRWCRRAVQAYARGAREDARRWFLRALDAYPGDPNALHGLARLQLEDGAPEAARADLLRAIEVNGGTPEQHLVLAWALERLGDYDGAAAAAAVAAREAAFAAEVAALQARLPVRAHEADAGGAASRLARCPCGSGRRYKHCCGRLRSVAPPSAKPVPSTIEAALRDAGRGEALSAERELGGVHAADLDDAITTRAIAALYAQLGHYDRAVEFQRCTVALGGDVEAQRLLDDYCEALYGPISAASAYATARDLLGEPQPCVAPPVSRIHIVTMLASLGGTETRALALYELLAPHADVTLWSVARPHASHASRAPIRVIDDQDHPDGGTVVFVGTFFEYGDWLHRAAFDRVVVCHNIGLPAELVQRLTQIRESAGGVRIELTFPSERFRARCSLPGRVELSPMNLRALTAVVRSASRIDGLVIGRHSRDDPDKHHPNDASLLRRLVACGHHLRILGGTPLAAALAGDPALRNVELLPAGSEAAPAFLATLDCFLYRKSPSWYEAGGTSILEAMAAALPVVAFDEGWGGVDWVVQGETGFVVHDEDEALARIAALARDPALRARMGAAARRHALELVEQSSAQTLSFYLRWPGSRAYDGNCAPGVERAIASSSSFMSAAMSANSGVLR